MKQLRVLMKHFLEEMILGSTLTFINFPLYLKTVSLSAASVAKVWTGITTLPAARLALIYYT